MRARTDRVLRVQAQLTCRDRLLLDWLADHDVLTTAQIAHALFGSLDFAQRRLLRLHRLGLLDRFRPLRPGGGSFPWHYVLAHLGAEIVAASRDQPPPRPAEVTIRARRVASARTLQHRLGINQFFTDLAGHARTRPAARLLRWWSERRCARPGAFGQPTHPLIRPDGHGVYSDGERTVAFFLEHDTGSEPIQVLAGKLHRYAALSAAGGPTWPVLFWLPSAARERHLHQLLARTQPRTPVATAARDSLPPGRSAAEAVWLPYGTDDPPRPLTGLGDLADPPPQHLPTPGRLT